MSAQTIREQLIAKVLTLTDEQASAILQFAQTLEADSLPDDYDPDNDPTVGLISGPTDVSERVKEILRDDIDPLSGWTQKAHE
jgi:hypothetical protein